MSVAARPNLSRWVPPLALVACVLGASSIASAQQASKEDVAKADKLFSEAQVLVQKGQYAEGCKKFAESQKLDPANGTLINLALCHEKEGKVATAYRELQELLALMSNSKNPDDKERGRVANERLKVLDKKLPRVSFDVSALPKDVTITLDGEKVNDPSIPTMVDPGSHTVDATASGKKPGTATFEVRDAGTINVKIEGLIDDAPPPPPPPPPPPKPAPPPETSFWSGQRVLGAGVATVGLVGIGVGAVFGLKTFDTRDQRDAHCKGTVCDAEGIRLHDDARQSALISSIGFIGGGVALAVGGFLFFTASSTTKTPAAKVDVGVGPGSVLLRGAF